MEPTQIRREQSEPSSQTAGGVLPVKSEATFPAVPPVQRWAHRFLFRLLLGFGVLVLCLLTGEQVKIWLRLPIPGNVLGLLFLLLSFRLRLVPPQLIEDAANRVLYLLPSLFIPIYVSAIGQGKLWSQTNWVLFPTLVLATAGLWIFVGHVAQRLLGRSVKDE